MKKSTSLVVTAGVLGSRLGWLPPNMSPVGSLGFFGTNIWQFALVTVGFDLIWGGFYKGVGFTYLGFLSYYLLGKAANSMTKKIMLLPMASFLFFAISNLGVWWSWYPRTGAGLAECLMLALPFYRNTLLGDMLFGYGSMLVGVMTGLRQWGGVFRPGIIKRHAG